MFVLKKGEENTKEHTSNKSLVNGGKNESKMEKRGGQNDDTKQLPLSPNIYLYLANNSLRGVESPCFYRV